MSNVPLRILILSDVHFGSWSHYTCDFVPPLEYAQSWATELLSELRVCLKPPGILAYPPYDCVVLNGDITSLCEADGYAATSYLIEGLVSGGYIRSRTDVLLIPGNHDVWRDPTGKPCTAEQRTALFREKYQEFLGLEHPSQQHCGVLHIFEEQRVALIGLDSCRVEGSDNPGIGYIGFDQLDSLVRTLEKKEVVDGPYRRIAFVHHHIEIPGSATPDWILDPKEERRFSFTADAKHIKEGLSIFHVDLLVHGHYHTAELNAVMNRLSTETRIISAGSAAGAVSRCTDRIRQFMLLEVWDDRMELRDFRVKGAGNWMLNNESFPLAERRSVEAGEQATTLRQARSYTATLELHRYAEWARAGHFFSGEADATLAVKQKLAASSPWRRDVTGFDAAWKLLADALPKEGERWLHEYREALKDPTDSPTLDEYVLKILKRSKS